MINFVKVLFFVRPDLYSIKAGDTIQITSMQSALKEKGVQVDICLDKRPDLSNYDLVHCFNILRIKIIAAQTNYILQYRKQKNAVKPLVVITPIYWNMEEFLQKEKPGRLSRWRCQQKKREEVLKRADLLTPNARAEWELLKNDFNLTSRSTCRIIYNGVDPYFYKDNNITRYDIHNNDNDINTKREGILSVGRIHKRKNQLQVIRALKKTKIPVLFIGDSNNSSYLRQCYEEAGPNIKIHSGVKQKNLKEIYKKARVHILASWYDTPGLVNLEAGLAGCNLVTTNRGTAHEYLGDTALYCDPDDPVDIKRKALQAYSFSLSSNLSDHIFNNFTWDLIASSTLNIYSELLASYI